MTLKHFMTELLHEQGADTFVLIRDDPSSVVLRTSRSESILAVVEEQQQEQQELQNQKPKEHSHKEVRFHSGCRRHSSPPSYPKRVTSMDKLRGGSSDIVNINKNQQNASYWWDTQPETNSLNFMVTNNNINSDVDPNQQLQQIARQEQRVDNLQSAVSLALSIANPNKMKKKGVCNSPRRLVRSLSQHARGNAEMVGLTQFVSLQVDQPFLVIVELLVGLNDANMRSQDVLLI
eukprot:scaffold9544_cov97-Cylindrotheca_fusiformis.AAC.6